VKEHDILKRDKNDIISTLNITLWEAILGTKKNILTLDGMKEINIKPGT
jgi:DnaJ-class molecular chaperone